ncbi:cell division suppressor protein YneA [Metabacillus schmidteae]|uniref:cell division suppressor protein YneA n=1 Tax=Metabacillus schmidteae TaxID=2730405 RepID=UPI00158A5BE6|nr:LysM peptidoglycan-binding domain-containing protein [Metabacillus schmidteae]
MKKESLSYILAFFVVLLAITVGITYTNKTDSLENYHQVEIKKGDSLWTIADQFQDKHNISKQDFVKWVQEKNEIHSSTLTPGEIVFVPIHKEEVHQFQQIASE